MRILFIFLLVLSLPEAAADAAEAICPKPLIEAEVGEDVFLQCHLDPPVDLSPYTVDWKRADNNKVVYSYRRGQENRHDQMQQYRNRTSLDLEDLSRGNMTLRISSVRLSDTGRYKCFVPKWWISCSVTLSVVPKHQHNGTNTDAFSTTKPPQDHPEDPDHTTIKIVSAAVVTAAVFLVGFLVWINRGTIQTCWRRLRGETAREAEMENGHELKSLNGAAGNGLGDNKQCADAP